MTDTEIRRFESARGIRDFDKGRFEVAEGAGLTLGQATYESDWKWSMDVGAETGHSVCAAASFPDKSKYELRPGGIFHILPGDDSWVLGDEPYVAPHLLGVEGYAK